MRAASHRVSRGVEPDRTAGTSAGTDAFRRYVVPELPVLLRVARRITGDPTDAEDLVQETLMRAYRAIDRFDGRHPRAWLLTILRNTWRNMNRRARPHLFDSEEDILSVAAGGADGRGGAEEQVLDRVLDAELARALQDLSHKHRAAIVLVDIDGLSYQEAADVLAIPPGTVMSRLHRARKRLRRRLEQRGYPLGVSLLQPPSSRCERGCRVARWVGCCRPTSTGSSATPAPCSSPTTSTPACGVASTPAPTAGSKNSSQAWPPARTSDSSTASEASRKSSSTNRRNSSNAIATRFVALRQAGWARSAGRCRRSRRNTSHFSSIVA